MASHLNTGFTTSVPGLDGTSEAKKLKSSKKQSREAVSTQQQYTEGSQYTGG